MADRTQFSRDASRESFASRPAGQIPHEVCPPFASDPGWDEAWWWLGGPIFIAALSVLTWGLVPDFYRDWVLPEGYGVLELSQFLLSLAAFAIGVKLMLDPYVRAHGWLLAVTLLGTLGSFYIGGEEMSWGQHIFQWATPESWGGINRQNETNLHNTFGIFEKTPRAILEFGIVVGGLLIPFAALLFPWVRRSRWSIFFPAAAIVPTALGALFFKLASFFADRNITGELVLRPSETTETYYYLFVLIYMIILARRVRELKARR